jgi:uncharacterized protein YlxW (UPF0749 family)
MQIDYITVALTLLAATLSGFATALIAGIRDAKKEKVRRDEIDLYKLEKELTEWKDKYYQAIQELITLKAELENALSALSHIEMHEDIDSEYLK